MMKVVSMDRGPVGDDGLRRLIVKHQVLEHEYDDLQTETRTLKKTLQKAKLKEQRLLAEVRFLRRRYKYLIENQMERRPFEDFAQPQAMEFHNENMTQEKHFRGEEATTSNPRGFLDLNQISELREDEAAEYQVAVEPLSVEKKGKKRLVDGDVKLSICREVGNNGFNGGGAMRGGKRKITWQDRLALKV
ncbi:uncharacterized protein LOC18435271 [Amborella trichopoda]|uniref:uncharacterized protein LOC18435271 n=1 Tax=Amborella trichopoda TaxID=13333 RepID=UPI0005D43E14|nr:uncharacterized protein LOC18435271 [Amborella trichopoda]|eukprot:XP_011623769.1 uncharacterized protein LOC18435271 [Amborella trichopoda]